MHSRRLAIAVSITFALLAATSNVSRSEPPSVSYIYPAGGQRGTTVEFRVGGHFLHGECPFEMTGTGLEASQRIREVETLWFEGPLLPLRPSQRKQDYPS